MKRLAFMIGLVLGTQLSMAQATQGIVIYDAEVSSDDPSKDTSEMITR